MEFKRDEHNKSSDYKNSELKLDRSDSNEKKVIKFK